MAVQIGTPDEVNIVLRVLGILCTYVCMYDHSVPANLVRSGLQILSIRYRQILTVSASQGRGPTFVYDVLCTVLSHNGPW
jgi:hypothetical protein